MGFPDCNSSLNWLMLWNDTKSLKKHRRGALLFFKVICQISRSHRIKNCPFLTWIEHFWIVTGIHWWLWNNAQSLMWPGSGALLFFEVIHLIFRSYRMKNQWFKSNLSKITRAVAAIKSLGFALLCFFFNIFFLKVNCGLQIVCSLCEGR